MGDLKASAALAIALTLLSGAPVSEAQALAILELVRGAVRDWEDVARGNGATRTDIIRMAAVIDPDR